MQSPHLHLLQPPQPCCFLHALLPLLDTSVTLPTIATPTTIPSIFPIHAQQTLDPTFWSSRWECNVGTTDTASPSVNHCFCHENPGSPPLSIFGTETGNNDFGFTCICRRDTEDWYRVHSGGGGTHAASSETGVTSILEPVSGTVTLFDSAMPRPDNVVTVATWSVVSSGPGETSAEMGAGTSSLEAFSYRNWVCPSVGNTAVSNLRCYDDDDDGGGGSLPAASTVHEADAHATAAMVGTSRAVEMPKGKPGEAGRDVGGRGSSGALAFAMVGMAVVFAEL